MKSSSKIILITATVCGISLHLTSCETYDYMRDPDASKRAEALERSALLSESEANMPSDGLTTEGLPNSGPAAFYNDFPEGTNPTAPTEAVSPGSTEGASGDEYEHWVNGPDGILVPASSLKKDDTPEAAADEESPSPVLPE